MEPVAPIVRSRWGARTRITIVVTVAFTLAAAGLSIGLVLLLRSQLIGNVDHSNDQRARDIAALLDSEALAADNLNGFQLPSGRGDNDLAQVIAADGTVLAASSNLAGQAALPYDLIAPTTVTDLPIGHQSGAYRLTSVTQTGVDGTVRTVVVGRSIESMDDTVATIGAGLIIGVPLLTALVALMTWVAVARSLRPVEAIRVEFSQITTTDLHRRVPHPRTRDELGALADTLNDILGRLEREVAVQHRFVADAAHELRSPLAALAAQLEIASTQASTAADAATSVSLLNQCRRLEQLIDDLLVLARYDKGIDETTSNRLVDLDELVLEEVLRARLTSPVPIDATAVSSAQVRGDGDSLQRVVRNLVDNATRHARTKVTLALHETGPLAVLTVDNDGPPIAPGDRERIFERFTRLDEARDRLSGGTGLGLAISIEIADRHHGTISAGDSPGGGARFTLTIPAAAPEVAPRAPIDAGT